MIIKQLAYPYLLRYILPRMMHKYLKSLINLSKVTARFLIPDVTLRLIDTFFYLLQK